ncbi:MAG: SUMF1/EgtB/PvdO family nonheme iron enzyme [Planctomycetota bacterium]|jgi:serine/threonine-protein kinase
MLRRYDDGSQAAIIKGHGRLELRTAPSGARVSLLRLENRNGLLQPGNARDLGESPVVEAGLPMGSYLCRIALDGYAETIYPVNITRNRSWTGAVKLRTADELGEAVVVIPGGPYIHGDGSKQEDRSLGDFAIGRHPVTFEEYAEFLSAVETEQGLDAALARLPESRSDGPLMERRGEGDYVPVEQLVHGAARERLIRDHGEDFALRIPVLGVSWLDASAYCTWKAARDGLPWRLPTDEEREKAGRGVDGRRFPWGDLEEPSLARCKGARQDPAQPEPVGAFPTATSIYGVEDSAGGCWEWTDSWSDARKEARLLRGGFWNSVVSNVSCTSTQAWEDDLRLASTGFRCALSLD